MCVQKEDEKDQEVRGLIALSNGTYAINTWVAEKQAFVRNSQCRFTVLFEQPLKKNR